MKFLHRRHAVVALAAVPVLLVSAVAGTASAKPKGDDASIDHIVVIYEENHSFDNLFGGWEGVNGLANATPQTQVDVNGTALPCLPQNDANLASPPLSVTCTGSTSNGIAINSHFTNAPFAIDDYIKPADKTCPDPKVFAPTGVLKDSPGALPGGCTRDIVHRYYNEQYQIDGGKQDRYVTGSDAAGLAMGHYSTQSLPIYAYLHSAGAPHYAIADNFFQGAFGGSFLNHQWLIAAATPIFPKAPKDYSANDLHSIVGPDGFPAGTPLHPASPGTKDTTLTQAANADGSCQIKPGVAAPPANTVCGDYAVNTIQPPYQPFAPNTPVAKQLPPQTTATIGDRLSGKGVDWAWYSGGWSNADGDVGAAGWTNGTTPGTCADPQTANGAVYPNCPNALFQYHHQPFNYFANYAPGTTARAAHLRDEAEFIANAKSGHLKPVSFVKPVGAENEHPGYASETNGSSHLVDLIKAIQSGPEAKHTLIVVTYDEFGGQWDHVAPPMGQRGISDQWGPGTRIPELTISPLLKHPFSVDETEHDTTSILTTIEHLYGLAPLSDRDAAVKDLFRAPVFPGNRP